MNKEYLKKRIQKLPDNELIDLLDSLLITTQGMTAIEFILYEHDNDKNAENTIINILNTASIPINKE